MTEPAPAAPTPTQEVIYKCYHCKQDFQDGPLAEEHFGLTPDRIVQCVEMANKGSFGGPHAPFVPQKMFEHVRTTLESAERRNTELQAALKTWHDRLGNIVDQVGHPDYSLREMITGMRSMRDEMFAELRKLREGQK